MRPEKKYFFTSQILFLMSDIKFLRTRLNILVTNYVIKYIYPSVYFFLSFDARNGQLHSYTCLLLRILAYSCIYSLT